MGNILLLLHAHLPYVRHPEHERHLEETWFFEAATESYLPLFELLLRLPEESPRARLALSVSPTLLEMMADPLLSERLISHLDSLVALAYAEVERTSGDPDMAPVARMYLERFSRARQTLKESYNGSLLNPLRQLAKSGNVELLTTSATHAYLPNLAPLPHAVRTQIRVGRECFNNHLGHYPKGFWLPECGYYEGLDSILAQEGAGYTFLSSGGLLHARPRPSHGLYRPIRMPSGVVAFGRERKLSMLVWSTKSGYPANPVYRDFYRDAGFDLDAPHIREFVEPLVPGGHAYTGLKYHRITGATDNKEPYRPEEALIQARKDAVHFTCTLASRSEELRAASGFEPLFVLPFDAELFGHWWNEGPLWLEHFLKGINTHAELTMRLPEDLMKDAGDYQEVTPSLSSWGHGGYGHAWSDSKEDGKALALMLTETARFFGKASHGEMKADTPDGRALRQGMRELLLLQSSDWGFLSHKDTATEYSRQRMAGHVKNLGRIMRMLDSGRVDEAEIRKMKERAPLFPGMGVAL
ncbi:MAG: DUF1957 domain-containing protein [Thermodesulfovibrionales bacterium]|nr:DUF1957 domain-containing protein [Thermodesulfovibrionales bacterium]